MDQDSQHEQPSVDVNQILRTSRNDRLLHRVAETMRREAQLPDYSNPDRDDRWKYLLDGVGALENVVELLTATGGYSTIHRGVPLEASELPTFKTLAPEEAVKEIGRRIQDKTRPVSSEESPDASAQRVKWTLRHEGFLFGLRALGLNVDSNGSVIPGGTRVSSPAQQHGAVNDLKASMQDMPQLPSH